jgi:hypothetical protein
MADSAGAHYLKERALPASQYKKMADRHWAGLGGGLLPHPDPESTASLWSSTSRGTCGHAGALSRSDGEKPDRNRDSSSKRAATRETVWRGRRMGLLFGARALRERFARDRFDRGQVLPYWRRSAPADTTRTTSARSCSREALRRRRWRVAVDPRRGQVARFDVAKAARPARCADAPDSSSRPFPLARTACISPRRVPCQLRAAWRPVEPALLSTAGGTRGRRPRPQAITAASPNRRRTIRELTLLHHYVTGGCARSFHEALRADPTAPCAGWVSRGGAGRQRPGHARRDRERAAARAEASPRQAFIALRAKQIEAQDASGRSRRRHQAMQGRDPEALAAYPTTPSSGSCGNAEGPGQGPRPVGGARRSRSETALVRSPGHFGAHHYLMHSFRNIAHPAEAAELGRIYAAFARSGPRPAHAGTRLRGWSAGRKRSSSSGGRDREAYAKQMSLRAGDDWHHLHNLQLLGYTYLRLGKPPGPGPRSAAFDTPARLPYRGRRRQSRGVLSPAHQLDEALAVARALQTPTRTPRPTVAASSRARRSSRWASWTKPACRRGAPERWIRTSSSNSRRAT